MEIGGWLFFVRNEDITKFIREVMEYNKSAMLFLNFLSLSLESNNQGGAICKLKEPKKILETVGVGIVRLILWGVR